MQVIGTVTRVSRLQATVNIQVVNGRLCANDFVGVIRTQDVRQTDRDKVKIVSCFRPGDLVRATIVRATRRSTLLIHSAITRRRPLVLPFHGTQRPRRHPCDGERWQAAHGGRLGDDDLGIWRNRAEKGRRSVRASVARSPSSLYHRAPSSRAPPLATSHAERAHRVQSAPSDGFWLADDATAHRAAIRSIVTSRALWTARSR